MEGDGNNVANREKKTSPVRNLTSKVEYSADPSSLRYEDNKPKAVSELGSLTNYEPNYNKQESMISAKYEGFVRQPKYASYRSNLMENFGSRDKPAQEDYYPNNKKTLNQSSSATYSM